MILESLLGSLLGGAFRLIPEGMKLFERKDERKHELAMFDKQLEADRLRGKIAIEQADASLGGAEIQAIIEATKAQAMPTGIKWVDALSCTVRPIVTYLLLGLYMAHKLAVMSVALSAGTDFLTYAAGMWGPEDMALLSSIMSFWFVDRSLRKKR